jgi:hypothetical protein
MEFLKRPRAHTGQQTSLTYPSEKLPNRNWDGKSFYAPDAAAFMPLSGKD